MFRKARTGKGGFWRARRSLSPPPTRVADEADICEVVIRKRIEDCVREMAEIQAEENDDIGETADANSSSAVLFISVNGRDPSDEFLHRFHDVRGMVRKASRCKVHPFVVDKKTREGGILVAAGEIRWTGPDSAEAEGSYQAGSLCGAGTCYAVRREDSKWLVNSGRMSWIS